MGKMSTKFSKFQYNIVNVEENIRRNISTQLMKATKITLGANVQKQKNHEDISKQFMKVVNITNLVVTNFY